MFPFPLILPKTLADQYNISVSSEVREWFIRHVNPTFDSAANANRSDLFSRVRLGVGLQTPGNIWNAKLEYQNVEDVDWTHALNASQSNSDASLAYVRYTVPNFTATGGRQKIELENQRLIGSTDWLSMSRSFDAARIGSGQWDLWGGKLGVANTEPQTARVGALTHHDKTWGTTSLIEKHDVAPKGSIDIQTLDQVMTYSFGKTSFDGEGALQYGTDNGRDQRAWAWHIAGHEDLPWSLRLNVQADAASGGGDAGTSRTFDNLYPSNHNLYGLADMIAWKNMEHFAVTLEDKPGAAWTLRAGAHQYYLWDPSDEWYSATSVANPRPGGVFVDPTGNSGRNLGREFDLEAEFYAYATTGQGLNASLFTGVGTQGATTGGSQVTLDANTMAIATEIAKDEMEHVVYLRQALGSAAIAKPAINLAALGIGFANQAQFLTLARAFEDVGVSAYGGAVTLISSPAHLQAAAQILATEAYHAGNIRLQIAQQSIPTTPVDSQDVLPPPSGSLYFTNDQNALAIIRTTQAVLNIVYAGGASSGGFFPAGFNGSITASLAHK